MIKIISGGNIFKKMKVCYRLHNKHYLSIHIKTNKLNKFILPLKSYCTWDFFNKIKTSNTQTVGYSHTPKYLYKYLGNSWIVMWTRVTFYGKGFRIRNFQQLLKMTFSFGHSHWTRIKFYTSWFFWKLRRQSYLVVTSFLKNLLNFEKYFPNIKLVNKYTKRGLRIKKQPIIRRFGKISQVVSLLH